MEVQRDEDLHYLVDELRRWRDIIGSNFEQYKLGKIRQSVS
jgi:hypothetical protein